MATKPPNRIDFEPGFVVLSGPSGTERHPYAGPVPLNFMGAVITTDVRMNKLEAAVKAMAAAQEAKVAELLARVPADHIFVVSPAPAEA